MLTKQCQNDSSFTSRARRVTRTAPEDEGSRSIHERSGQTIADAEHQVTEETVEGAVWTVCAARWCYSLGAVN
jgi:hypothetical protein